MPVKEWPLPIALTGWPAAAAALTAIATSSVLVGCSTCAGVMLWLPAQLAHMACILSHRAGAVVRVGVGTASVASARCRP